MTVAGGASATSHTIMGLTNGIGYEIAVRAVNAIDPGRCRLGRGHAHGGHRLRPLCQRQASGVTITSDIVLVNVETSTVTPAIYFYNQMGEMIDADSVVDLMGDLEVAGDGGLDRSHGDRRQRRNDDFDQRRRCPGDRIGKGVRHAAASAVCCASTSHSSVWPAWEPASPSTTPSSRLAGWRVESTPARRSAISAPRP